MQKWVFFLLFILLCSGGAYGQVNDSLIANAKASIPDTAKKDSSNLLKKDSLSLQKTQSTTKKNIQNIYKTRKTQNQANGFIIVILILLSVALLRYFHPKYYSDLFKIFRQGTLMSEGLSNKLQSNNAPKLLFLLLYFLITAFVLSRLFLWLQHEEICKSHAAYYFFSLLLLFAMYLYRIVLIRFIVWLLSLKKSMDLYLLYNSYTNQIFGLFLVLPSCLLILCIPQWQYILIMLNLVLCIVLLIFKLLSSLFYLKRNTQFTIYQFLFYLCAFEILPLAVLTKWLWVNF